MVTARMAAENRIHSYTLGADDYVTKPYTPDRIFRAIAEADDRARNRDRHAASGAIPLGSGDDGETLRRLGQLRNLLLGGTPLGPDDAHRLGEALRRFAASADEWGRGHGDAVVARLAYQVDARGLRLTFDDATIPGWIHGDARPPSERWAEALDLGGLVIADHDPVRGTFTLARPLATP